MINALFIFYNKKIDLFVWICFAIEAVDENIKFLCDCRSEQKLQKKIDEM